jgi:hypothetical protein
VFEVWAESDTFHISPFVIILTAVSAHTDRQEHHSCLFTISHFTILTSYLYLLKTSGIGIYLPSQFE